MHFNEQLTKRRTVPFHVKSVIHDGEPCHIGSVVNCRYNALKHSKQVS